MIKMLATKLVILGLASVSTGQDLTCPTGVAKPSTFYVIGASGGDIKSACENTAAATTAGISAGMNAVELDISVSQDNVVFLWNDPVPLDPSATARSQVLFVTGMCRPMYSTFLPARNMVFSLIRQTYKYANETGTDQEATIPTLHEWMDSFAANSALQLVILDLKVAEISLADFLIEHIMVKAQALGVQSKIRLVSSDYSMAGALQSALARLSNTNTNINANINIVSRVFGGTTGTVHFGYDSTENFDAISEAKKECYGMANLGQTISSNGWREYQTLINKMVALRDSEVTAGGNYVPIIGWRINKVEKMAFLMCIGVDGLYTDEVASLAALKSRQDSGAITCCNPPDTTLGCLTQVDPRILGQGCSSMGLSWYDLEVTQCPLLDIDFLYSGTKLTCRQSKFCKV